MAEEVMTINAPWYESIGVGIQAGNRVTTNLVSGFVYLHYSTPLPDEVELHGFNINFVPVDVRMTLSNTKEKKVWSPFFHTPITAIAGLFTQAMPVLLLPEPQKLPPFSRIQIVIANNGSTIEGTILTLVGIRKKEQVICFS